MVTEVVVYTVVHQPRRIKLPAQPIPLGASVADIERCLFDEEMNERYFRKVAATCYYPATERFLRLTRAGMKLAIGFSVSFLRQAQEWDPILLARFQELVAEPNVELIGVSRTIASSSCWICQPSSSACARWRTRWSASLVSARV